jgi:2,3-bisphosphoglycerate-independent phosphoglycerate mutase
MSSKATALLLILDGWGHREETDSNAIAAANTPTWDQLWREQPTTLIDTSGKSVASPSCITIIFSVIGSHERSSHFRNRRKHRFSGQD